MMLGFSLAAFTKLHVIISFVAIVSGLVAMVAFALGVWLARVTHLFLWTTLLTTVSGFMFPFNGFTPAIGTGVVSSAVLALAFWALYVAKLQRRARTIYAITAVAALYLNLFVLVVQSFLKVPALHVLAPQGNEPAFAAAQGLVLIASLALGVFCLRGARRSASVTALAT